MIIIFLYNFTTMYTAKKNIIVIIVGSVAWCHVRMQFEIRSKQSFTVYKARKVGPVTSNRRQISLSPGRFAGTASLMIPRPMQLSNRCLLWYLLLLHWVLFVYYCIDRSILVSWQCHCIAYCWIWVLLIYYARRSHRHGPIFRALTRLVWFGMRTGRRIYVSLDGS